MKFLFEIDQQSKIDYLKSHGISVEKMANGKLKIEDPKNRIEDFFIYDEPNAALAAAHSIVKSWLD